MTTDSSQPGTASLRVEADAIDVEPGASASAKVRIRSTATQPVDVVVDVLSPNASWCSITPGKLRLAPDEQAEVTAHVQVPMRLAGAPQPTVVGVRAMAPGAEILPHVGELRVRLRVTVDVRIDLIPEVQRVSGRARLAAVVRNEGHIPVRVQLEPGDFAPEATMRIRPTVLQIAPRTRTRAKVVVRAPAPWSGVEPDHQLTVRAVVGTNSVEALASFVQRTRLGSALLVLAGLLVVLAVFLVAMMFRGGDQQVATAAALAAGVGRRSAARDPYTSRPDRDRELADAEHDVHRYSLGGTSGALSATGRRAAIPVRLSCEKEGLPVTNSVARHMMWTHAIPGAVAFAVGAVAVAAPRRMLHAYGVHDDELTATGDLGWRLFGIRNLAVAPFLLAGVRGADLFAAAVQLPDNLAFRRAHRDGALSRGTTALIHATSAVIVTSVVVGRVGRRPHSPAQRNRRPLARSVRRGSCAATGS